MAEREKKMSGLRGVSELSVAFEGRRGVGVEDVSPTIALTLTLSRGERGQLRAGRYGSRRVVMQSAIK